MPEVATIWGRTKQYSSTAYDKALKPGFDKAYNAMNKLEPHANRYSNKIGSEAFWPTTMDKESAKAARILRSFCKDGFYDKIDEEEAKKAAEEGKDIHGIQNGVPQGTQRVVKKIPAKVIQNAKGLAIFTCMRTGWIIGGSGGAGVLVGRHPETGEWSPPSGIHMQNLSVGFLGGVDLLDTVLVINSYEALEAFTKLRCTLGTEVGLAAGPVGIGGVLDTQINKKPSPVWSYVKSRGLYGGIGVEGNVVIERTDENERFYGEKVGVAKILLGEVRYPPVDKYKVLLDTIRAAQGENVDESYLPEGAPPSDMELEPEGPIFGIPQEDDPDPFGYKALEAEGLVIREAGTHRKASPESFEFRPSPSSPVFNTYRKSVDHTLRHKEWRGSVHSVNSMDRGTQTDEDEVRSPGRVESPSKEADVVVSSSPLKEIEVTESSVEETRHENTDISKENDANGTKDTEKPGDSEGDHGGDDDNENDDYSDIDSDAEISTAVPVTARPKAGVVNVPKRIAPALPPRNPGRLSTRSPLAEENAVDGFEQVSLEDNESPAKDDAKQNDHVKDPTTASTLAPAIHVTEDEFHSVPPSPMREEQKKDDTVDSFR